MKKHFQNDDGNWLREQALARAILSHGVDEYNTVRSKYPIWTPDLREADLRDTDLQRVDLRKADLRWVNLRWVDLREADLRKADLRRADLRKADLRWVNLREANLREANLQDTDLRWVDLREADLREADLRRACLDFSSGLPLWCGSFGVTTDLQIEAQHAYHTLRRQPDYDSMSCVEMGMVRASRAALVPLANSWAGIERHRLPKITDGDV